MQIRRDLLKRQKNKLECLQGFMLIETCAQEVAICESKEKGAKVN